MTSKKFRDLVFAHYAKNGRHGLPWRKTTDPYKILVSEVMLQQTQVERVIPYFKNWMEKYPTVKKLAEASLADVLIAWQGLGYNRRAKGLWEAAKVVTDHYSGKMPTHPEELEKLPGIGSYTARAVAAFSHNQDVIFIETNIRTAVVHHFFPNQTDITDTQIREVLEKVYPKGKARKWYSALMDYGSHLKRSGVRLNSASKGYVKQKTFAGSDRQARGAILKALAQSPLSAQRLGLILGDHRLTQVMGQLARLHAEGMLEKRGRTYHLPR